MQTSSHPLPPERLSIEVVRGGLTWLSADRASSCLQQQEDRASDNRPRRDGKADRDGWSVRYWPVVA